MFDDFCVGITQVKYCDTHSPYCCKDVVLGLFVRFLLIATCSFFLLFAIFFSCTTCTMWILLIIKTQFASNSLSFDTLYHSWLSYGMLWVQFVMGAIEMSVYDDFMMVMMILCLIFSLTVGYCKCR